MMLCTSSVGQCSLAVEHPLSKREVVGSNPAIGFLRYSASLKADVRKGKVPKTLCPSG